MKRLTRTLSLLGFSIIFFVVSSDVAFAKGPPDKVNIDGPGLETPIEVTDFDLLKAFSFFQFEDVKQKINPPENPGEGYRIIRYIEDKGKLIPWDRLVYYPQGSEAGIIFDEGLIGPNSTEFDGYWYRATPTADVAMKQILSPALIGGDLEGSQGAETIQASVDAQQPIHPEDVHPRNMFLYGLFSLHSIAPIGLGLMTLGLIVFFLYNRRKADSQL